MTSPEQLVAWRLSSQRLDATLTSATEVVREVCGVQAQDVNAALLAIRARSEGLTAAGVHAEWHDQRNLVRTWCMRGTLHLVARADLPWMLALFGPEFIRKTRRRYEELGLSEKQCRRAVDLIGDGLAAHGAQTRQELAEHLERAGVPTEGQAVFHLIRRAALAGVVCYGPDREGAETFMLLDVALADADERLLWDMLALRYVQAYGPAQPGDLARWSGLSATKARLAWERIADRLAEVRVADKTFWMDRDRASSDPVHGATGRLLPAYDNLLLGYQTRDLILDQRYARRVHPGGGLIRPTVLADNRLAGTWKMREVRRRLVVQMEPFKTLSPEISEALEAEARDVGRFLGREVQVGEYGS